MFCQVVHYDYIASSLTCQGVDNSIPTGQNSGMWSEVIHCINEKQRFIITTHVNPDLDALGSELALDEYLRSLGKDVSILNSDSTPHAFRFADPQRRLQTFSPSRHQGKIQQADVVFVLDASGGWDRVGRIGDVLAAAANRPQGGVTVICVDHHPDPVDFAHLAVVNTDAAASAELVFDLITQAGGAITSSIARSLYLAILTDTGSFRYPKTSPQTHRIAARLIEGGADPMQLYKQVYERQALSFVRLKGHVLTSLQVEAGGQLVWCALDQATLKAYGVAPADMDGFPGLGMQIGGVRVSVLCVEMPRRRVKISLRSDGSVAINGLAIQLGGGGHPSAAGALVEGELAEVTAQVVAAAEVLLAAEE
jgi:phosphoesterase RecJ-like protein